jgi:hypothetical protein
VPKRMKPGEPAAGDLEARVTSLNPRGYVYSWQGKEFPPDEWVDVTEDEAGQLLWLSAFTVRLKESP